MKKITTSPEQTKQLAGDTLYRCHSGLPIEQRGIGMIESHYRLRPGQYHSAGALSHDDANIPVIALTGELGTGKTVFAQGIAEALGIDYLPSPTFTLMNVYHIKKNTSLFAIHYSLFVHIDCYRLDGSQSLIDIGLSKYLNDPRAIVAIEWADKIKTMLQRETIWISFEHGKVENERLISFSSPNR